MTWSRAVVARIRWRQEEYTLDSLCTTPYIGPSSQPGHIRREPTRSARNNTATFGLVSPVSDLSDRGGSGPVVTGEGGITRVLITPSGAFHTKLAPKSGLGGPAALGGSLRRG